MLHSLVSVVIPTTRRHDLVQRALASVMAQTYRDLEIIVVVDGPNPETVTALSAIADPRLRVLETGAPCGAGAARNFAAARAKGRFIAFLDDDDEWMPEKIARQVAMAGDDENVMVLCRAVVRTPRGESVWPRTDYDGTLPIDEYLFDRRSLFRCDALSTSSYFLPLALFMRTQFGDSRQQEDTTLLLRVTKQAGARVVMVPEILVALDKDEGRERLGPTYDWREMKRWVDGIGHLITPRAYSGFCLTYLGSRAARLRDVSGFWGLLFSAFRRGRPTLKQLIPFLAFWIVSPELRERARGMLKPSSRASA